MTALVGRMDSLPATSGHLGTDADLIDDPQSLHGPDGTLA